MKKIAVLILLITIAYSCGSNDRGEVRGVKAKKKWFSEKPYQMTLIPGGSFTMGKQDEDLLGTHSAPARTVTVRPFYMDEMETTNGKYKEFVNWVRDSIVRYKLAEQAEFASYGSNTGGIGQQAQASGGISDYAFKLSDTTNLSAYDKYRKKYYDGFGEGLDSLKPLDWSKDIIWDTQQYPDEDYVEVMDSLYIKKSESADGIRTFDTKKLNYIYTWFDVNAAVEKGGDRKNFLKVEKLNVYPDTTVWVKDFNYSYNDPMHQDYFYHQAYNDYPVVGVTWHQAKAYCHWKTKKKNTYVKSSKKRGSRVPDFRLPTEPEWEYAARGGLKYGKYPWGGPSTTSDRGCFLANFKPVRGDYAVDGALYTMESKSFNANDYGLYNMAGNVSEWTNTAYNPSSYLMGSTMNPNVEDRDNKRKIIRGGSWKDVAYFLEVSTRDYEYADTARSYIGFRTVQDYLGDINK